MKQLLFAVGLFASITISAQKINKDFVDGEIFVKIKNPNTTILANKQTDAVNVSVELPFIQNYASKYQFESFKSPFFKSKSNKLQGIYRIKIKDEANIDALVADLKSNSSLEYVHKVHLRYTIATPNDPQVTSQWFLTKIQAFDAWDVNAGVQDVVVAVVDNAVQSNHVDLATNMVAGRDVADNDTDTNPPAGSPLDFSHGTHVAGIVGAVSNNGVGIASASNNRVKIMPIKATPDGGNPRGIYYGYEGVTWAADNGAKIISLSWGGTGFDATEQAVINYAIGNGCIIIAAAGNENTSAEHYPAAYANVISVASLDSDDKKSSFSNYGSWVDISAPGRGILSTIAFDNYGSFSGTSMATPLVSSVLGYILACSPTLTAAQAESLLKNSADNIDTPNPTFTNQLGSGRINLLKAISCLNNGLANASISAQGSTYFCEGESVTLQANLGTGLSYVWKKDGVNLSNTTSNLTANSGGIYQALISKMSCSILSNELNVNINTQKTPSPSVSADKDLFYCTNLPPGSGFIANPANCAFNGPSTFAYTGGTVGYDAYESSGANPTAVANSLGGTISNVKISITWQKKDGNNENSCANADGGAAPYNEEVSFKIKSPSGKIITLINAGTYARGSTTSGVVTTIFDDAGSAIATGSLPISGIFKPAQVLTAYNNEPPNGTWELLPQDDGFVDPLCVSGFSVIISTNAGTTPAIAKWYNAAGNLIHIGNEYNPLTHPVREESYFVETKCDGLCASDRVKLTMNVKPVPYVIAYPLSQVSGKLDLNKILNNDYSEIKTNENNIAAFLGASMGNPVTPCSTNQQYLLLALGCNGTVSWNIGQQGAGIIVTPTQNTTYNAFCVISNCPQINSNEVNFKFNPSNITISQRIEPTSEQTFVSQEINAQNKILTPSKINYKATKSIILNHGFSVQGNSVFNALIGGCD